MIGLLYLLLGLGIGAALAWVLFGPKPPKNNDYFVGI